MDESYPDNFLVVIRSSGERTEDACRELLLREVPAEHLKCIRSTPFEEALRVGYRIGLESRKKWLITADADVLVKPGSIRKLISEAEKQSDSLFKLEGYMYDGILLEYRKGGLKLFNTSLLDQALTLIPANGTSLRPESEVARKMEMRGYQNLFKRISTGYHDLAQFRKDLYRKSAAHAVKHEEKVIRNLPYWIQKVPQDRDIEVILTALFDAFKGNRFMATDAELASQEAEEVLSKNKITEKSPKYTAEMALEQIESIEKQIDPLFPSFSLPKVNYFLKKYGIRGTVRYGLIAFFRLMIWNMEKSTGRDLTGGQRDV